MSSLSSQAEHIENDANGADRDPGIRDVERPEVHVAPVDIHEIDDIAGRRAIDEVSERPAEDQGEPDPRQSIFESELSSVGRNGKERDRSHTNHDDGLERKVDVVEQTEGGTCVL